MEIGEVPLADVRGPLTAQRSRLLGLLASLNDAQWATPTAAPHWLVKDIALHLLDVDLSWIARNRDHDQSGVIPAPPGHEEFVRRLASRNQRGSPADRERPAARRVPAPGTAHVHLGLPAPIPRSGTARHHDRPGDFRHRRVDAGQDGSRLDPR
jgi:hypothetical protein